MGASWLAVDTLIRETEKLCEFPHAEALPSVTRARDIVAETAMVVSLAGLSEDPRAEAEAHDLLARARVAVLEAQLAVRRASEAVTVSRAGRARALQLMAEARALRARDRSRAVLSAGRMAVVAPSAVTALMRLPEPSAS
jgi:fatty acid/phospholipid biosynthesis enzyme